MIHFYLLGVTLFENSFHDDILFEIECNFYTRCMVRNSMLHMESEFCKIHSFLNKYVYINIDRSTTVFEYLFGTC